MANPEHVKIVKQGAAAIERWKAEDPGGGRLDLRGADLTGLPLEGANLFTAQLFNADLSYTNLTGADLTLASLTMAILVETDLKGADFNTAVCGSTVFAECNLAESRRLESVIHDGPSSIGIDTLIASFRGAANRLTPELETFFRGAGVPKELLDALPRIVAEIRYHTCFVCYGDPDREFAEKLVKDLYARGISYWIHFKDATPGERTWKEIRQKRREADKMVALCSAAALIRKGVKKEVEEQIDEDPDKLVPVSLDNLWKEPGFPIMGPTRDLQPFLLERNYADFSVPSSYEKSLERLLKGLELKHEPQGDAP